ncbi:MAG: 30S ribosomal protein S4e [Candidatus Lokiarchaeota archaeon]|nr:30S ribosomal protein S4e [Candidatus Lokiarchaeota archaeon]
MTRHAGQKRLKRLNTPKFLQIKRKHGRFFVKPSPGPHPSRFCLPLIHIVRDVLQFVDTNREAKKLVGRGNFKVDGKIIKDGTFPVGLMDVLSIEKMNKHYRILPHSHYGLVLHEIPVEESAYKLCRINKKTYVKGGNLQLNLHDGRNILIPVQNPREPKEDVYKRMDVLKISVPEQEIQQTLSLKDGNLAIIMDGKNIGQVGTIKTILRRFGPNASTVSIEHDGEHTETSYDYTFVIGEDKPEISLPES